MYYKIILQELPSIKFAHSHTTDHYEMYPGKHSGFLEIVCYQQGNTIWEYAAG